MRKVVGFDCCCQCCIISTWCAVEIWAKRTWGTVRVNCPVQEHIALCPPPGLEPGVARAKHEAAVSLSNALPRSYSVKLMGIKIINVLRSFNWLRGFEVNSVGTKVLSDCGGNQTSISDRIPLSEFLCGCQFNVLSLEKNALFFETKNSLL